MAWKKEYNENSRIKRKKLKRAHLCARCGKNKAVKNLTRCKDCKTIQSLENKKYRQLWPQAIKHILSMLNRSKRLAKELPLKHGWPDRTEGSCFVEEKIGLDVIRPDQINRFAWIKKYCRKEVNICWKPERKGLKEEYIFKNWQTWERFMKTQLHKAQNKREKGRQST